MKTMLNIKLKYISRFDYVYAMNMKKKRKEIPIAKKRRGVCAYGENVSAQGQIQSISVSPIRTYTYRRYTFYGIQIFNF